MKTDILQELGNFQVELKRLTTAVDHIDEAKEAATAAIQAVNEISSLVEEHIKQLSKRYQGTVDGFAKEVGTLSQAVSTYRNLNLETKSLSEKIENIGFPERFQAFESFLGEYQEMELAGQQELTRQLQEAFSHFEKKLDKFLDAFIIADLSNQLKEMDIHFEGSINLLELKLEESIKTLETNIGEDLLELRSKQDKNFKNLLYSIIGVGVVGLITLIGLLFFTTVSP